MSWRALVPPRLGTTDRPGMCLQFAQSFFGAPVRHRSAWHAWLAQKLRHGPEVPLPDVPVLLWFEHWGAYDDGNGPYDGHPVGESGNWGDVRIHVPGDAIYGAPITGHREGQSRVAYISDIERGIGATYVGWSEDINGLRVAEPGEEDDMFTDDDRKLLTSVKRALFDIEIEDFGKRTGGIGREILRLRDALFKPTETSFGTPGGTLATLKVVLEQNRLIMDKLGIESDVEAPRE